MYYTIDGLRDWGNILEGKKPLALQAPAQTLEEKAKDENWLHDLRVCWDKK